MIIHEILRQVKAKAQRLTLCDLRLGLGYTAAKLSDGSCGVAYSFRGELGDACAALSHDGEFEGESAWTFAEWAASADLMRSVVGVAVVNALLSDQSAKAESGNIFDHMDIRPEDRVGMVGGFCPHLIARSLNSKEQLSVFERRPTDGAYPDWAMEMQMPACDVAIITSTTFIQKTLDHILAHCQKAREVIVVGATACNAPDVLRAHGVTLVAGLHVTDADRMLRIVSRGGGGRDLTAAARQTLLR